MSRSKSSFTAPESYKVNDHVLVAAPWSKRDGEPYLVARIMEVLPAVSTYSPNTTSISQGKRIRVGYYLRPRDISNRTVTDYNLVVATMHSDVIPASYIKSKCLVVHKDEIDDLNLYRKDEDHFYFNQLYDRYLHRYFEVVLTNKLKNAPESILQYLVTSFEYIVCEAGISIELCDPERGCMICKSWAPIAESVACALCTKVYHLTCLDPPLPHKPKTGYSWACGPCSRRHDEQVEVYMERGVAISTSASGGGDWRGAGPVTVNGKGKAREMDPLATMRTTNGWQLRYFGMHTEPSTIMDPHDSLYPRASTRLGNGKYQCVVADWEPTITRDSLSSTPGGSNTTPSKGPKGKGKAKKKPPIIERGDDATIRVTYRPDTKHSDEILDEFVSSVRMLPLYQIAGVDLIDKALSQFDPLNLASILPKLKKIKQTDLGFTVWSDYEIEDFIEVVAHHGNDIEAIVGELKTKSIADVVRRYYMVVGHEVQEDEPQQLEEKVLGASNQSQDAADESDHDGSICEIPTTPAARRSRVCAICESKSSRFWYRCPDNVGTGYLNFSHVLCDGCSFRWRHYGNSVAPVEVPRGGISILDSSHVISMNADLFAEKIKEKEEKVIKHSTTKSAPNLASTSGIKPIVKPKAASKPRPKPREKVAKPLVQASTSVLKVVKLEEPVDTTDSTLPRCLVCNKAEDDQVLFECFNCSLAVHAHCYGVDPLFNHSRWFCDLCKLENENRLNNADLHCVLCSVLPSQSTTEEKLILNTLDILKPTEMNNFIHLLCGIWHTEIKFRDFTKLDIAEGVSLAAVKGVNQICSICRIATGCCIKCESCPIQFHLACAWTAGYRFAMHIVPAQKRKCRDAPVEFNGAFGMLEAGIWCKAHAFNGKRLYELNTRDSTSNLTALQTFMKATQINVADSPVLRRAQRSDQTLRPVYAPLRRAIADSRSSSPAIPKVIAPVIKPVRTKVSDRWEMRPYYSDEPAPKKPRIIVSSSLKPTATLIEPKALISLPPPPLIAPIDDDVGSDMDFDSEIDSIDGDPIDGSAILPIEGFANRSESEEAAEEKPSLVQIEVEVEKDAEMEIGKEMETPAIDELLNDPVLPLVIAEVVEQVKKEELVKGSSSGLDITRFGSVQMDDDLEPSISPASPKAISPLLEIDSPPASGSRPSRSKRPSNNYGDYDISVLLSPPPRPSADSDILSNNLLKPLDPSLADILECTECRRTTIPLSSTIGERNTKTICNACAVLASSDQETAVDDDGYSSKSSRRKELKVKRKIGIKKSSRSSASSSNTFRWDREEDGDYREGRAQSRTARLDTTDSRSISPANSDFDYETKRPISRSKESDYYESGPSRSASVEWSGRGNAQPKVAPVDIIEPPSRLEAADGLEVNGAGSNGSESNHLAPTLNRITTIERVLDRRQDLPAQQQAPFAFNGFSGGGNTFAGDLDRPFVPTDSACFLALSLSPAPQLPLRPSYVFDNRGQQVSGVEGSFENEEYNEDLDGEAME